MAYGTKDGAMAYGTKDRAMAFGTKDRGIISYGTKDRAMAYLWYEGSCYMRGEDGGARCARHIC